MNNSPDREANGPHGLSPKRTITDHPNQEWPALQIETIEGFEPLDPQTDAFSTSTVPDALFETIFGQPEPPVIKLGAPGGNTSAARPLQTYAILDAAKVTNLPELLECSGLEHRCLFKGKAEDDLKNVAPWVVRLEEGNPFTRSLFTRSDAAWHLWNAQPGIYVRAYGTLDGMWRHFRKFTRIQDEKGKWYFLAFWSHPLGTELFRRGNDPTISEIARKILTLPEDTLSVILVNEDLCTVISSLGYDSDQKPRWLLTRPAWNFLRQLRREQQFDEVVQITWGHAKPHVPVTRSEFREALRRKRDVWFDIGFWRRDHFAKLCSWEALLGPDFLETYKNGVVLQILHSSASPHEAIAGIEKFLQSSSAQVDN